MGIDCFFVVAEIQQKYPHQVLRYPELLLVQQQTQEDSPDRHKDTFSGRIFGETNPKYFGEHSNKG